MSSRFERQAIIMGTAGSVAGLLASLLAEQNKDAG